MFRSMSRIPAAHLLAATSVAAASFTTTTTATHSNTMSTSCDAGSTPNVAISKSKFTPLVVSKNEVVGVNVHKVILDFPQSTDILGMTTAGMLMVEGNKRGGSGKIARPYTPVSRNGMVGKLELVVKDYPDEGNVSTHICNAKVGESISVKGCFTKIDVTPNTWKKVGMIAGGSGLTPCLQVAEELLSYPEDKTEITLLFCNQTPEAIFLQDHIDLLVAKSDGRFKVYYVVDKAPKRDSTVWEPNLVGYVTQPMITEYLPPPNGTNNMIMVCGPPPMYKSLCGPKLFEEGKPPAQGELTGILKDMGFTSDAVFKF